MAVRGRVGAERGGESQSLSHASPPARGAPDAETQAAVSRYEQLGDFPARFRLTSDDITYREQGAHTLEKHGPEVPLHRGEDGVRTIEGRIYGDEPWARPESWSYRWTDRTTMQTTINDYVAGNWESIRSNLALDGFHEGRFDAGHLVGEGFYNRGMYGAGPREAHYAQTSFVRLRIELVPGSDPAEPFVLTAFPAGLL